MTLQIPALVPAGHADPCLGVPLATQAGGGGADKEGVLCRAACLARG